ncbi:MAG: hypothetical protein RLZZ587_421 [Actinomycetota bacterium]|jgi:uncharacterized protein (DUF305 family)
MRKTIATIALSTLMAFGLSGCISGISSYPSAEQSTEFGMNDIMFAQMMIPHHEQAVELATIAETNTSNPEILDLASRIKNAQQPEIDLMKAWLDTSGSGMDMGHNMNMPGIVSDEDMAAIRAARDTEFDALFLTHMIAHHKGAIDMVNDLLSDTTNAEAKALGQAIITAQTAEISEMTALLAE